MKKNMLMLMVLVLTILNLILSSIVIFVVVPSTTRTNKLVDKVASIVGMELEMDEDKENKVDISDISTYQVEDSLIINLKKTGDKDHFAIVSATLSINSAHKDADKLTPLIDKNKELIKEIIISEISGYEKDEIKASVETIKSNILSDIHDLFDSNFIINISFGNMTLQ